MTSKDSRHCVIHAATTPDCLFCLNEYLDRQPIYSDYSGLRAYSPKRLAELLIAKDAEIELLREEIRRYAELNAKAFADEGRLLVEVTRLRAALLGLNDFYKNIWDRADGGIMLFAEHVPAFEKAQATADAALSGEAAP